MTAIPMNTSISTKPSTMRPVPKRYQALRENRRGFSSAGWVGAGRGGSPYGQPGGGWAYGCPGRTSGGTSSAMPGS